MFVDVKTHLHKLKVAEHVNFPVVLQGALSFVTKTHSSFAVITKLKILLIDGNGKNSETRTLFYNLQEFWFPCVFHLFFFIYISRCDKSNKTGSYFYYCFLISSVFLEVAPLSPYPGFQRIFFSYGH